MKAATDKLISILYFIYNTAPFSPMILIYVMFSLLSRPLKKSRDQDQDFWSRSRDQDQDFDQRSRDQDQDFMQRSRDRDRDLTERSREQP